jgi:hypothetical protein
MIFLFRALRRHTSSEFGHFDEVHECATKSGSPAEPECPSLCCFDLVAERRLAVGLSGISQFQVRNADLQSARASFKLPGKTASCDLVTCS